MGIRLNIMSNIIFKQKERIGIMGVDARHYVIIGLDILEKVKDDYDLQDEIYYKAENMGLKFVYDGMNGEYAIIGLVVNEGDMYEGMNLTSNQKGGLDILFERVEERLTEILSNLSEPLRLYTFTHWS
jgi:hypothetical protein